MSIPRVLSSALLLVLGVLSPTQSHGQTVKPVPVTRAQFATTDWLVGSWRGSGGNYPSFFEDYRRLNDSTMRQRSLSDSTFRTASDSSEIAWRGGFVYMMSGTQVKYVVTRLTKDSLQFARPTGPGGGFTWVKESDGQWKAILAPPAGKKDPTVYVMRRVRR